LNALNTVYLDGELGADAKTIKFDSGDLKATFSVATTDT
jgi:hypothetical protein